MEIKDCKPNTGSIELTAQVLSKEEPRSFEKFGKSGTVCNARIKDQSGEIKLTLWNDDAARINVGDTITLQDCWCSEYRQEKQLSTGRAGKIEVVSSGSANSKAEHKEPGKIVQAPIIEEELEE